MSEYQYLDLLHRARYSGEPKPDRTGTGTLSVFGAQMRFDLKAGYPAVTTKRLFFHGMKEELLWMIRGDTNARTLQERDVQIWNPWAGPDGNLGPIYGAQWRSWRGPDGVQVDQLRAVLDSLVSDPHSRRHVVSAWNAGELPRMALAPCHVLFQFYVAGGRLSCQVYQRSGDLFLGVPFNIASYALLTHLVAHVTGYAAGELVHTIGDAHVYSNHMDAVDEQLSRDPYDPPTLWINPRLDDLFTASSEDIELHHYVHHPGITAPVAV